MMASLSAHDFDDAVVVVAAGGVDGYAGGFVDDDQVFVFVDDTNSLCGDGGFVAVEGVADDVAVLDVRVDGGQWLAVALDFACLYGIFLGGLVSI